MKSTQFLVFPPKGYYLEGGGVRQSFALSPDGGRIAFTAKDASGAFRLFLRDFSELESRPVADGDGAYSVVWGADGRTLLFTAKGKLRGRHSFSSHILEKKSPKRKRHFARPVEISKADAPRVRKLLQGKSK